MIQTEMKFYVHSYAYLTDTQTLNVVKHLDPLRYPLMLGLSALSVLFTICFHINNKEAMYNAYLEMH